MQRAFFTAHAWRDILRVALSLLGFAGAIPDRTGRRCVGVGFRQPVVMRIVSFSNTSSFLVWMLLSHTGGTYSAALNIMASAAVRRMVVLAPHVERAKHRIKLFRAVTFPSRSLMSCLCVSCLSNFTPRYFDCGPCGRMFPLTLIASWRCASRLLKWKEVEVFFSVLNLSRHVCRKLARVSMSHKKLKSHVSRVKKPHVTCEPRFAHP